MGICAILWAMQWHPERAPVQMQPKIDALFSRGDAAKAHRERADIF